MRTVLNTAQIGRRVREMRKRRGWTAMELSARAGTISRGTLAKLECGVKPDLSLTQAIGIAHAFGIPVECLIADDLPVDALLAAAEIASARIRLDASIKALST